MTRNLLPLIAAVLLLTPQFTWGEERDIHAANKLFGEGKYEEALELYQELATANPEHRNSLYNGGMAAFLAGKFEASRDLWLKAEQLDEQDYRAKMKLIQAYRSLGDEKEAVRRVEALIKNRYVVDSGYEEVNAFCCDQFKVGDERFMAIQNFDFPEKTAQQYAVYSLGENGEKLYSIDLWSNEATNAILREQGELKEGERAYQIERYTANSGKIETFVHLREQPTYAEFKQILLKIVEDNREPVSSTTVSGEPVE